MNATYVASLPKALAQQRKASAAVAVSLYTERARQYVCPEKFHAKAF